MNTTCHDCGTECDKGLGIPPGKTRRSQKTRLADGGPWLCKKCHRKRCVGLGLEPPSSDSLRWHIDQLERLYDSAVRVNPKRAKQVSSQVDKMIAMLKDNISDDYEPSSIEGIAHEVAAMLRGIGGK